MTEPVRVGEVLPGWWPRSPLAPAKVVSERLGHASIAVTMDVYSHVLPGLHREAADRVARLILGAGSGASEAP